MVFKDAASQGGANILCFTAYLTSWFGHKFPCLGTGKRSSCLVAKMELILVHKIMCRLLCMTARALLSVLQ